MLSFFSRVLRVFGINSSESVNNNNSEVNQPNTSQDVGGLDMMFEQEELHQVMYDMNNILNLIKIGKELLVVLEKFPLPSRKFIEDLQQLNIDELLAFAINQLNTSFDRILQSLNELLQTIECLNINQCSNEELENIFETIFIVSIIIYSVLNMIPILDAPPPAKAKVKRYLKREYPFTKSFPRKRIKFNSKRESWNYFNMTPEEIKDETLFGKHVIEQLANEIRALDDYKRVYGSNMTKKYSKQWKKFDLETRLIVFLARLRHGYTYQHIRSKYGMSKTYIVYDKYHILALILFALRNEISFDNRSGSLRDIIGYLDHTHLPTSKHHAFSRELFRSDKGSATILMLVVDRLGNLLFASGGYCGRSNDRYVVTISHLKYLIKEPQIIYADDGFYEKDPHFIHTPKYLRQTSNEKTLVKLSNYERNSIEMFFRLPKMFKIFKTTFREIIGIQVHYYLAIAMIFSRYLKKTFQRDSFDSELFNELLVDIDCDHAFSEKFWKIFN